MRHFLDIREIQKVELREIIEDAKRLKLKRNGLRKGSKDIDQTLSNFLVALIFEKPSTRTRVSFDTGIYQLGGKSIVLFGSEMHLSKGESAYDNGKVLSSYVDMAMMRCFDHKFLLDFANSASIPVINGLTNSSHPCQVMADILTYEEVRGPIKGKTVVWVGDGNNVCRSYIHAAVKFEFRLVISCPIKFKPDNEIIGWAESEGCTVDLEINPLKAVEGANLVVTDTHVSMHDISSSSERKELLKFYQVNEKLMKNAEHDSLFMHCLPAYRGEEVTTNVIDGSQSVVFEEAENRLHVQKAIMRWCTN